MNTLQNGTKAETSMTVTFTDTAKGMGLEEGDFPEVFATSRMIALMEGAAAKVMVPLLQEGQLSVGVGVNIMHLAATPNHETVTAVATFTGMQGKLFGFKIEAYDRAGLIGKGEHTRAIIDTSRLLSGAAKRFASLEKE